jgi:hypothetical protein
MNKSEYKWQIIAYFERPYCHKTRDCRHHDTVFGNHFNRQRVSLTANPVCILSQALAPR